MYYVFCIKIKMNLLPMLLLVLTRCHNAMSLFNITVRSMIADQWSTSSHHIHDNDCIFKL